MNLDRLMADLMGPGRSRVGMQARRLTRVEAFGSNPGELDMWLYAPPSLAEDAPLVVVLHGCSQTADGYAAGAGWLELADRLGFCVVCPEQRAANNPNRCFNWFEPGDQVRSGGEPLSIRQMVAHAIASQRLDAARVYVTGLSAGGAMTAVMLATYPEVFAAGAVVAGLPFGAASTMQEAFGAMMQGRARSAGEWGDRVRAASLHRGPWPRLSIWHGDADMTVRPGAAEELAKQWTDVHGLRDGPTDAQSPDGRPYLVWRTASDETAVELHRIPGMAHGTPLKTGGEDGCGAAGPFLLEVGVCSSLEIAAFWGLVEARVSAEAPRYRTSDVSMDEPALSARHRPRGLQDPPLWTGSPASDVGEVINKALRAAGLMK